MGPTWQPFSRLASGWRLRRHQTTPVGYPIIYDCRLRTFAWRQDLFTRRNALDNKALSGSPRPAFAPLSSNGRPSVVYLRKLSICTQASVSLADRLYRCLPARFAARRTGTTAVGELPPGGGAVRRDLGVNPFRGRRGRTTGFLKSPAGEALATAGGKHFSGI